MHQALLNMGMLQLAITALSVLASHSTHRQAQSGRLVCKFSDLPMFWISWKKCIIWTNYFYYFSFHVRRHYQDEDSNLMLRILVSLKSSTCPQRCIDQLIVTKNGDGIRFCLQGFSSGKESKIFTSIWVWRREVLVQEIEQIFRWCSHVIIRFTIHQ